MDLVSLIHGALAGSTTSTYKVGIQRYLAFCKALDLVPVPSTKRQVALFATHLSTSLRLPTIRVYLAAVSFLHHVGGHRSPVSGNTILKLVLRGIQRKQTQSQSRTPRLPITPQILADLLKHLGCDSTIPSQDILMLKAAMSLAFFGFLRVSELTVPSYHTSRQFLARRDIQFLGHQLKVFLTHSKTDQFGQGSVITVGCSEDTCCPVSAMQHYLESCRTPPSKPLFHFRNGTPLTAKKFRAILHYHLKSLGFNPSLFNTHSFRIGAATAAAKAGMSSSTIMELGRWRSAAFHSYVRHHPAHPSAAAQMAKAQ
jgi:integrase